MANITINLDGNAEQGLEELEQQLDQTAAGVNQLATSSAKLNQVQQAQITIVKQQATDWKSLGTAVAKSGGELAKLGVVAVKTAYALEEFGLKAGLEVIGSLTKMAEMTVKYTLLTKGATSVIGALKGKTKEATAANDEHGSSLLATAAKAGVLGVVITTLTGKWKSVGEAASATAGASTKAIAVIGPVAAAAGALLAGYEAIMSRTGKKSLGMWEDTSKQTEEQAVRWENLVDKANRLGKSVDDVARAQGILNIEAEFGVSVYEKFESNLDRVKKAANGLGSDLSGIGSEFGKNLQAATLEGLPLIKILSEQLPTVLKIVDQEATKVAESNVRSIHYVRDLINNTREYEELHEKLDAQREKEKSGFEGLQKANATLADRQKERARAAEIASIKTVEGIEREIQAVRTKAGEEAQAGRAGADIEKDVVNQITALEAQRTAIHNEEIAKRRASDERVAALQKQYAAESVKGYQVAAELRVKATQDSYDKEKRILEEFSQFKRDLANDARTDLFDDAEATIKARGEQAKARADLLQGDAKVRAGRQADRDTEDALHALRIRRIQEEMQQKIGAAKNEDDVRKALYEAERKRLNADADFNRQRRVQQLQDESNAAVKSVEIERDKQAKLKALQQQALEKAGVKGEDLLQLGKRADVVKILQDQAAAKAKQKAAADNQGLFNKAQFDSGGADKKKYDQLLKKAQQEAIAQATKDFNKGKTDPQQLAQAQGQAAKQTVGAFQKQGKLSVDTGAAMGQAIQAAADLQATTDALQRQMNDFQKQWGQIGDKAKQMRKQAQAGGLQ